MSSSPSELWNDRSIPDTVTTVPAMVAETIRLVPERIALVHSDVRLSYAELGARVAQLTHRIRATRPSPEDIIAIGVPRSAEMVIGVLAVMAAGCAFVPVDPSWPQARRRQVLADSRATLVLTVPGRADDWPVPSLEVSLPEWHFEDEATDLPDPVIESNRLAYVIFTSGSTGTPKGAMIRHEAICERLRWQRDEILHFGHDDASLFKAPLAFDIAINEILLPLVSGGRLVLADPGGEKDPEYLLDLIETEAVTYVYLVSSMLDALLQLDAMSPDASSLTGLRHVWCGGEVLTPDLFRRFRNQLTTTLYHGYGPAEATIGVSHVIYRDVAERIATSIGAPNPHTQLYVLDESLHPVPPGVGGELYAAGFLLGRGYVNASALTGSRFVANPFDTDGSRMYRTGDLARWTPDGTLEFLGRADNQVKIRGRRIELEEIESALADHPRVHAAVVVVHEKPTATLVAFVTTDGHLASSDLTVFAADTLPDYMIPSEVVVVERMPVTANGKVDRAALTRRTTERVPAQITTPPGTPREVALCSVFADVLGLGDGAPVDIDADFFALGGDSIVAIRVVARLRSHGFTLRPRDMFAHRTVRALAPLLGDVTTITPRTDVNPTGPVGPTPIAAWLDEVSANDAGPRSHRGIAGFYQGMTVATPADVSQDDLAVVVDAVMRHHDLLTARTASGAGNLVVEAPRETPVLTVVDESEPDVETHCRAAVDRLAPEDGVMVSVVWFRRMRRLLVVVHHIVVDGISLRIIADDLAAAHRSLVATGRPRLDEVPVAFRGWAHALRETVGDGTFDADIEFWRTVGATADPLLGERPLDPAIDTVATESMIRVELSAAVTTRLLTTVPESFHGRVDDAMIAALALAVQVWRRERGMIGSDAVLLELEGHGREGHLVGDADISRTVGWFTTLYPAAVQLGAVSDIGSTAPRLGEFVRSVKDQLRSTPSHGLGYGALRYLAGHDELAVAPQILFNYLGRFEVADDVRAWSMVASADPSVSSSRGGVNRTVLEGRSESMPLPRLVEVNAETADTAEGPVLSAVFSWPRHAVDETAITRLADLWTTILDDIAHSPHIAGHSVSDFPLVPVTTDDIRRIESGVGSPDTLLPLTSVQQGIWFHSTYSTSHDPYVVQQLVEIRGDVDRARFEAAVQTVVERHQALGAAFTTIADGSPVAVHTVTGAPEVRWIAAAANDVETVAASERARRFDLAAAPLMRFTMLRHSASRHTMIQTVHHIIADGWSVPIVLDDLATAYRGDRFDRPAPRFENFLRWLADRDAPADRAAWRTYLDGVSDPTRLAAVDGAIRIEAGAAPEVEEPYGRRRRTVDPGARSALETFARSQSVTTSAVITTLWGILVGRLLGRDDVVFGTAVSGRGGDLADVDTTVGLLINTIVTRVRRPAGGSVIDTVRAGATADLGVIDHHHIPLTEVLALVGEPELFDTLLVIENLASPRSDPSDDGLTFGAVDVIEAPHYPVTVMVSLHDEITVAITNDRGIVSDSFADTLSDLFCASLVDVSHVQRPVAAVETTPLDRAESRTVDLLLDDAAIRYSDRVALVMGDVQVTYDELAGKAAAVTTRLVDAGVGRGDVVGLLAARSIDTVAALWAVIASGATYLPMDPTYPSARIRHMIDTAGPVCVLADELGRHMADALAVEVPVVGVHVDTVSGAGRSMRVGLIGDDAVSVVFTSGSTGTPRAVVGTHGALSNRLSWAARRWPSQVRLAKSSLSFIDGTTELLGALVAGSTIVLADDEQSRDGAALAGLIADASVRQVLAVPSLARAVADEFTEQVVGVRRWVLSGEPLDVATVRSLRAATPAADIVNSYGSSEVAGDVLTDDAVEVAQPISVGTAVPGSEVIVLGTDLRELPVGVIGEIYVGGVQLARGYLGATAVTATRFVAHPGRDGRRLYRTGDLGWRRDDGSIMYVGRSDDQLTVNGFRIEPAEVEAAITSIAGVTQAAVFATGSGLAAAVVADGSAHDPALIIEDLSDRVPHHLVPSSVTMVDAIPLLPNGKRDRHALETMVHSDAAATVYIEPASVIERDVVTVMSDVLGTRDAASLSADADFFRSGGDSIAAIRLVGRLARIGHTVTGEDVFRGRTAIGIAARCRPADPHSSAPARETVPRFGTVRLSQDIIAEIIAGSTGDVEDIWATTPLAQGVFFQCVDDTGATYVAQNIFTVDHRIDVDAMRRAFSELLRRNPQMRAGFRVSGGVGSDDTTVVAVIAGAPPVDVAVHDLSDAADAECRLADLVDHDRTAPFDLAVPPLIRLSVVRLPDGTDRLLLTYHFLLFDGWSRELVLRELFHLYDDVDVPTRPAAFTDYLRWRDSIDTTAAAAAWSKVLGGLTEPTLVTGAGSDPTAADPPAAAAPLQIFTTIDADLTTAIRNTAYRIGVTDNAVLTTALAVITGHHSGTDDVVIGTTVAGRPGEVPGIDETIGLFLNTVPARIDLTPSHTVVEVISAVAEQRIETMPHEHMGLGEIQRLSGHAQLFDSLFVLQNFLGDDTFTDLERAQGIIEVDYSDTTHFPITWVLTPGDTMGVKLEYRPDLITTGSARSMLARLTTVLSAIVSDTDRSIGSVCLHDEIELAVLDAGWHETDHVVPPFTVAELLAEQAASRADVVAVIFGDERVTYAQLDGRINRLARVLLARSAGPERIVALDLPRSTDMVVALFAVLRCGAAYLPLDREHPIERLIGIVDDAEPALLLTDVGRSDLVGAAADRGCDIVCITDPAVVEEMSGLPHLGLRADELGAFAQGVNRLRHPAYLIYTSGSTGKPKGVITPHIGLTNMYHNHDAAIFRPTVARADRGPGVPLAVAHTVSFSFDMSWEELFWLVAGHEVHICDEELRRDATGLVQYCRDHEVDVINVTPTYAHHLIDAGLLESGQHNPALVLLGGEAVTDSVWSRLRATPGVEGYNLYGPTEYTINTLGGGTGDSAAPTVGHAIWNTRAYLLDTALRPVPDGVVGELFIAGVGLARGYHRRPDLTAAAMVADPFVDGERMYRTGDLMRCRADGNLDYLGRSDDQIKIRGYRVELGEIETRLADLEGVARCAVIARTDTAVPGMKTLVAYVIPDVSGCDATQLISTVRDRLAQVLPAYMVPARYGVVSDLPLTVNGKLDVAALPEPVAATRGDAREPRTDDERIVADICQVILGVEWVGIDDDFFALGGDSISSISLSSRAAAQGLRISSRDVFRRRTVLAIAASAGRIATERDTDDVGVGTVPLTPMLSETRSAGTSLSNFYQSMVFTTPRGMSAEQLTSVLDALVARHEMLRAEVVGEDRWELVVPADVVVRDRYRLAFSDNGFDDDWLGETIAERAAALDPRGGVMMTASWHPGTSADAGQLLLVIHHLVVDGVSWRIIAAHLAQVWGRTRDGGDPRIDVVGTSFRRWAELLIQGLGAGTHRSEVDHWTATLTPAPTLGDRALDPRIDTAESTRTIHAELPADVTNALAATVPAAISGRVDDVLLAGLSLAVRAWRGARAPGAEPTGRLLVNLEGHGRRPEVLGSAGAHVGLAETLGWFTAIHPVAVDAGAVDWDDVIDATTTLDAAVKAVKEQLRSTPAHGLGYGVLRHIEHVPELVDAPTPEILFNYLGRFETASGAEPADWTPAPGTGGLREGVDPTNPAAALEINARIDGTGEDARFVAEITWPTGILDDDSVADLADRWMTAVRGLTRADIGGRTPSDFPLVTLTDADVAVLAPRARPVDDILPLLPLQSGMYFHSLLLTGDRAAGGEKLTDPYVVQQVARVTGPLDTERFVTALDAVVARRAALRARLASTAAGGLVQVIEAHRRIDVDVIDLRRENDAEAAAVRAAAEILESPLDLEDSPPIRFALLALSDREHRLVQTMHHALADGWSYPLMFADLMGAYRSGADSLPPLAVEFADHVALVVGGDADAARACWREALSGIGHGAGQTRPTLIESVIPAPVVPTVGHRDVSTVLSAGTTASVMEAARTRGVTVSAVIHAAWALVLGRVTGGDSAVFGSTVSGRASGDPDVTGVVGLLINTNPVVVQWDSTSSIADVVDSIGDFQVRVMDAQQIGLTEIARLTGHQTLFDTMVVVENFPDVADTDAPDPGTIAVTGFTGTDTPHYPVSLVAFPGDELIVEIKYDTAVVSRSYAEGLGAAVATVIEQWTRAPEQRAASIPLASGAPAVSSPVMPPTDSRTLVDVFAESAHRDPRAVAVSFDGASLTYRQLDEQSNALARLLIDAGAAPERRVGVALPRGLDLVVAVVAAVKTGAAYVPLDIASPPARLRHITDDANLAVLATCTGVPVPVAADTVTVLLAGHAGTEAASIAAISDADRACPLRPGHPAYLIYTSGSTGAPKAVEMPHSSVVQLFDATATGMTLDGQVWTMFHSVAFDFSVWELWGALTHGGRLVVVDDETCRDPARFVDLLAREQVTLLSQTPSAYHPLVTQDGFDELPVTTVVLGGEALDPSRVPARAGTRIVNMYGITETCVHVTEHELTGSAERASVVGDALPGLIVRLLDHRLQPVPAGLVGEIYVGGGQLARGYAGRSGLTAARFVADVSGARMYRSGDLAYRDDAGRLVYLGRADQQVSLRGYRIELGEVEHALRGAPGITDAAAAVGDDRTGRSVLVAAVVGSRPPIEVLRAIVAERVPTYMVPALVESVDAMPLSVNGKIDRTAVFDAVLASASAPGPEIPAQPTDDRTRTGAELITAAVAELLGRDEVGSDDDFFTLGGDSIVAISLVNRVKAHGIALTPRDVFTHRTARRLADAGEVAPAEPIRTRDDEIDRVGDVVLTPIVHRLAELGGTIDRLNQAEVLYTPAGADVSQIRALLDALVTRHDSLRLRLIRTAPMLWSLEVQSAGSAPEALLRTVDGTAYDDDALAAAIAEQSDIITGLLDPDAGEMLTAAWIDAGPHVRGRLILVIHHLAVDAVSWRILLDDLVAGWSDIVAGRPPGPSPASTPLRTYAASLTQQAGYPDRLGEFEFWRSRIEPGADLVPGASTFGLTVGQTVTRTVTVDTGLTERLVTTIPVAYDADITEVLTAGLAMAAARRRGSAGEVLIDLERHGRSADFDHDLDLTRTTGWFTSVAPVRLPAVSDEPGEAIGAVRDALRAVPGDGLGFGLLRYCNPRTAGLLARGAAPQVLFNYLGRSPEGRESDWAPAESASLRTDPDPDLGTPYLLEVNAICVDGPDGPSLRIHLTYPSGEDFAAFGDDWLAVLADIDAATGTVGGFALGPQRLPDTARGSLVDRYGSALSDVWPLSPLQEGLYFQAASSDIDVYVACNAFDLDTRLDADALREAMEQVIGRHRAMRSGFVAPSTAPGPVTVIVDDLTVPLTEIDLTHLDDDAVTNRLARITEYERDTRFDLSAPPLLRLTIVRLPGGRDRLVFTYHLLLWDGWSRELVLSDFFSTYSRLSGRAARESVGTTAEPSADFADYLRWVARQDVDASARAWAEHLSGLEETSILYPAAVGTDPVLARRVDVEFTEAQTEAMGAAAREAGVTTHAVISTALALLLSRRLGRADVVFGTTVAGRPTDLDDIADVVGVFLNTVPVRVAMSPSDTAAVVMRRVQDDRIAMMDHEYLGLGDIQRQVGAAAGGALFDSLYVLQNFLDDDTFTELERAQGITNVEAVDATHYPLTWVAMPGRRLWLKLEYRPDVVTHDEASGLLDELRSILLSVCDDVTRTVADVSTPAVAEITGRTVGVDDQTIAEMLMAQVVRTPDVTALTQGDEQIDYREFGARVNRTARLLLAQGAGPEQIVGLALPRSIDMVVGLFAALSVGAAYLPVDLSAPDHRIATVLDDASPLLVLVTETTRDRVGDHRVVTIDDARGRSDSPLTRDELGRFAPGRAARLDHPAYVIYTSGSTGKPKGVVTGHRGLSNMQVNHRAEIFAPVITAAGGATLTIAHTVSFAFDMSWEELLWLVEGHHVHICDEDLRRDPAALVSYCREHDVDVINVTPTYATQLAEQGLLDEPRSPRLILLGGEAVSDGLWTLLRNTPNLLGYNLYGPTEYTINTLGIGTDRSAQPAVGTPITNTVCYILDPWMRPVPDGVAGELHIRGTGLARCYLGQPRLTAASFVADIGGSGDRMYRTGDLVRRRADGSIDYLGRTDDQVKIRGHRVEPAEVTAVMTELPGVAGGSVIAAADASGVKRLVAYVIPAQRHDLTDDDFLADVRSGLAARLPAYLVPAAYATVDSLPLTVNGKLDVAGLPDPSVISTRSRPPADDTEQVLCDLFAEVVVGTDGPVEVGVADDFFALGGHSLLATRLLGAVNDRLGSTLRVRDLFDAPTPEALARRVVESRGSVEAVATPLRPRGDSGPAPLAPPQRQLWAMSQIDPTSTAYIYPLAVRLRGSLDADAIRAAVQALTIRHAPLRTLHIPDANGHAVQRVLDPAEANEMLSVRSTRTDVGEDVLAAIAIEVARPIDPRAELPIRVTLFEAAGEVVLLLCLHHLVADEWSDAIILGELDRAYRAAVAGDDPVAELGSLTVTYGDYAHWAVERLGDPASASSLHRRQIDYWTGQLTGAPSEVTIAPDLPSVSTAAAQSVSRIVGYSAADRIRATAGEASATMFMALHAAVAVTLRRFGAGDDVVVGSPQSGRVQAKLTELVGFFANTVVLRTDLSGRPTFVELVNRVRAGDLAAIDNADVPFAEVVGALNPVRSAGRNPLFAVMLGYFRRPVDDAGDLFGLRVGDVDVAPPQAKVDLNITCIDHGPGAEVEIVVEYDAARYLPATIADVADCLLGVLTRAAQAPHALVSELGVADQPPQPREVVETPSRWFSEFDAQAELNPDAAAIIVADRVVSYRELVDRSVVIADRLRAVGVGAESVVALALDRSEDLVAAMAAVHRVQAAYLPLDLSLPADRLAYIVGDAAPVMILTDGRGALDWASVPTRDLHQSDWAAVGGPGARVDATAAAELSAYLIYTSGSTGEPKGVSVSHRALDTFRAGLQDRTPIGPADRVLAVTTVSFDIAVLELIAPLTRGAGVVLADSTEAADPQRLAELIERRGVSVAQATPSLWSMLTRYRGPDGTEADLSAVRVAVGGEALPAELAAELSSRAAELTNMYGPTEATVWATSAHIDSAAAVRPPIGTEWDTVSAHVLDTDLAPVPVGVIGELYLGGPQVARGYHGRFALTSHRFVADPFAAGGERLYRTGDLVRRRRDGTLAYLGRSDHQVKIRGHRVEPEEVAAALRRIDVVDDAVVIADADPTLGMRLIGYVVPRSDAASGDLQSRLRRRLAETLPGHMVPSRIELLTALPTTPNGKVDRDALPRPAAGAHAADTDRALSPTELVVTEVFETVLGVAPTGPGADFFALGGHSLLLVRLAEELSSRCDVHIEIRELFGLSTVEAITARVIDPSSGSRGDALDPVISWGPPTGTAESVPVVCLPPASGLCWGYGELARVLGGDASVIGLQSRTLTDPSAGGRPFDDVVADYCDRIATLDVGPRISLVGWSFGGIIACAISTELRRRGYVIEPLVVLDAYRPSFPEFSDGGSDEARLAVLLRELGIEVTSTPVTMDQAVRAVAADDEFLAALGDDAIRAVIDTYLDSDRIIAEARIEPVDGPVLFLESTVAETGFDGHSSTGWAQTCPGIEVIGVAAPHSGMLSTPAVDIIAGLLRP